MPVGLGPLVDQSLVVPCLGPLAVMAAPTETDEMVGVIGTENETDGRWAGGRPRPRTHPWWNAKRGVPVDGVEHRGRGGPAFGVKLVPVCGARTRRAVP